MLPVQTTLIFLTLLALLPTLQAKSCIYTDRKSSHTAEKSE